VARTYAEASLARNSWTDEYVCGCKALATRLSLASDFKSPLAVLLCSMHEAAPKLRDALEHALTYVSDLPTKQSGPDLQAQQRYLVLEARALLGALVATRPAIPPVTGWVCWVIRKGDDYPCGHLNRKSTTSVQTAERGDHDRRHRRPHVVDRPHIPLALEDVTTMTMTGVPSYHKKDTAKCTAEELRVYDPLTYQIRMIHALAQRAADLKKPGAPTLEQLTENMLVESFALHFRNLVGFLWPPAPKAKDVYATHFTVSHSSPWTGPTVPKPTELVNRASREVPS